MAETQWQRLKRRTDHAVHLMRQVRSRHALRHMLRRGVTLGFCPICEERTLFYKEGDWLRDRYRCLGCYSIPRGRALVHVLNEWLPQWRQASMHECSPSGPASKKLARECAHYTPTQFFPGVAGGEMVQGVRCEDLEAQTFGDETFDLVVTQDVFEHIFDAARAFREVARTLKPGGAHVFTVPWYHRQDTVVRAVREEGGTIRHLRPPVYHRNPVDAEGSLVVREWGRDLCDFIYEYSGLTTTAIHIRDRKQAIEAEFIEVFVSSKPKGGEAAGGGRHARKLGRSG